MGLSELTIRRLKAPQSGRRELYDGLVPGFGIRVTSNGVRSFIFLYQSPTKHKRARITIGRVGEIGVEEARERARQLRAQVRANKDPSDETQTSRATGALFRDVVEVYAKRDLVGKRSGKAIQQIINRELMPPWGNKPIASIGRADVLERVEDLIDDGRPEAARRLFAIIRRLFNWAISRGTFGIEHSPCDRLRPTDMIGRMRKRTRILTDDELRALWGATGKMGYPFGPLLRLLMLTGLRRSEVAQARWTEFEQLDKAIWTIPAERMKSDVAHVEPLTPEMLAIIRDLPRIKGSEEFLFVGQWGGPVSGFSQTKKRLNELMVGTASDWVLHDIRRTVRTHLSALRVPELVKELVIAHAKPGLHQTYDQWMYLDEKREALELWGSRLMALVSACS